MRRVSDKKGIAAIPTTYRSVRMRSRLEAKWAAFFDALGWAGLWSYEPLDLWSSATGGKIPDFVLHFCRPVIVEAKPAFTIDELTARRRELVAVAADWLCQGAEDELRAIDEAPPGDDDLARVDDLLAFADGVRDRGDVDLWHRGRRALVVGSRLFELRECLTGVPGAADGVAIDGWHVLIACGDHVGLRNARECLVCGRDAAQTTPLPSSDVLAAWRDVGNRTQWRPPS